MNHCVEVKIAGVPYFLCYSLGVGKKVAERFGGMTEFMSIISEAADVHDEKTILTEYQWIFNAMLEAGYWRQVHDGLDVQEPPEAEEIEDLFTVGELEHLVISAIAEGSKREVRAEPPKNAEGAAV